MTIIVLDDGGYVRMNSLFLPVLNYMTVIMVHTRNRPDTPEGQVEIESTANRPGVAEENAQLPPLPNLLGGGPEQIPRFNLENPNPVLT